VLDRLIGALNSWLFDHNRRREGTRAGAETGGLALTTLTALVLRGPAWTVAHVGDTRAWLVRDGQCVQLTEDHAYHDSWGPVRLTRAVGLDDRVRVDYEHGEARAGDVFVLTSDGVHGVLARERIAALATDGSADAASAALLGAPQGARQDLIDELTRADAAAARWGAAATPFPGLPGLA
jgi:serine/threonine protein phosphatase PrpC